MADEDKGTVVDEGEIKDLETALAALKQLRRERRRDQKILKQAEEDNVKLTMLCMKLNQKLNLVLETLEEMKANNEVAQKWLAEKQAREAIESEPKEAQALMCGYMHKKGRNRHNWKRRWFVLKGGVLYYYSEKGSNAVKGTVPLETCIIDGLKEREQTGRPCMALIVEGRTLFCQADSKKENMAWFLAINCMQQQLDYTKKMKAQNQLPDPRIISFFNHPHVVDLVLDDNPLPIEGAVALESSIRFHTGLQMLSMQNTSLSDIHYEPFSRALSGNKSLVKVHFERNQLGPESGSHLGKALAKNETLEEIYLDENQLGDDGLAAIAGALSTHPNLAVLSLTSNNIGDIGAAAFAEALSRPHIMPKILLTNNVVGDIGATALAAMIRVNPAVHELHLSRNRVGNAGTNALLVALQQPEAGSVKTIIMTQNAYNAGVRVEQSRTLMKNSTLQRVEMDGFCLDASALAAMRFLNLSGFLNMPPPFTP